MGGCFSVPRVNQTGGIQTSSSESSSSSRCRPEAPVMSNAETNSLLVDTTCQAESRSEIVPTDHLHAAFGVAGVNIISQEDWRNNSWGESVFIQLPAWGSKPKSVDCVDQAIFVNALKEGADEFCNAVDGNAQGMGAKVGTDRYFKVSTSMGNFFVSLNKNANTEQEIRELKNNCSLSNKSATFLSLQHDKDVPIAKISYISYNDDRRPRPYIRLGISEVHGQDTYKVYSIKSQQQLSLDQAIQRVNVGNTSFPTRQPDGVMLKQNLLDIVYTPAQLTQIAKHSNGLQRLQILAGPTGQILLDTGYTPDQLTRIARFPYEVAVTTLQTLAEPASQSLQDRGYTQTQLIQIAQRSNRLQLLQILTGPTGQILLDTGYTPDQLTRVAKRHRGAQEELETLAGPTGQNLLGRGYTREQLSQVAKCYNGLQTLKTLAGPTCQSLQDIGYTPDQLTKVASRYEGSQETLETLAGPTGQRLLGIGYTRAQLTQFAERYWVGQKDLETLAGPTGQRLLSIGYTPDQLTQISHRERDDVSGALRRLAGPTDQRDSGN
ncbi:hypothetical protein [Agarilytica rhodophyticola]|uniref:hypothetical protein n=1 Tax=Agarilytica rhodophyticola TaxID=1737490 RepID=UPI00131A3EB2|nr:hypothetical protein [Agarilytica rhodophyticola]